MLTATEIAELDRRIAVMQAYRDGKKIEYNDAEESGRWLSRYGQPDWNWHDRTYRIAPEPRKPRECYAIFPKDMPHPRTFGGRSEAEAHSAGVFGSDEVVHMREVLPD